VTERQPVEPGYLTFHVRDADRAAAFFGALFDWEVQPGPAGEGFGHIHNTRFPMGFAPADDAPPITAYFRVDLIDRYAARVIELGGRVLSRNEYPSGGNAACVDDQGFRFDLFQPAPGY
jgi:predicted enzyme related to lactoylglutathione lyase